MLGKLARKRGERSVIGDIDEQQLGRAVAHGVRKPQDELARRGVGQMHAFEIDDHEARAPGKLGDPPQQLLGRAEEQRALRLDHGDLGALRPRAGRAPRAVRNRLERTRSAR